MKLSPPLARRLVVISYHVGMECAVYKKNIQQFALARQRFESRLRFFDRCISDITDDFHKQYGPYQLDWEVTLEACQEYQKATEDYLRSRDLLVMECQLLLGDIDVAETTYAERKAGKRLAELITICTDNDSVTLTEIDEDISNIRSVYKMIALAECERED